ncbi:MAG: pseudouridine synthase [Rickettsiales bacterium]|nr:pseudouridine synthase [Rickettsiales bacterium]
MTDNKDTNTPTQERIAKRMARAGLCSRREAEAWILEGKVRVNGKRITSPALNVSDADDINVNGKPLTLKEETRLWLYHKPVGLITTHKDPQGRPTVFDQLPKSMPRVISIGRLDLNSEGLLLLTNDGVLARKLEHPSSAWIRRYRVRVYGKITEKMMEDIREGVVVEGIHYHGAEIEKESKTGRDNQWFMMAIREGKNREIRKIFEHFGCQVNRLIRQSYGPFQLGSLPRGEVKEVTKKVLNSFIRV